MTNTRPTAPLLVRRGPSNARRRGGRARQDGSRRRAFHRLGPPGVEELLGDHRPQFAWFTKFTVNAVNTRGGKVADQHAAAPRAHALGFAELLEVIDLPDFLNSYAAGKNYAVGADKEVPPRLKAHARESRHVNVSRLLLIAEQPEGATLTH